MAVTVQVYTEVIEQFDSQNNLHGRYEDRESGSTARVVGFKPNTTGGEPFSRIEDVMNYATLVKIPTSPRETGREGEGILHKECLVAGVLIVLVFNTYGYS